MIRSNVTSSADGAPSSAPRSLPPERYEVLGLIALGGVGAVYRVKDLATGATLALKRLNREALEDQRVVESFEREYQVLAGLSHPRIIRVFDYGRDRAGPYYTMELVDGMDLAEAAPLPYARCCHFLRDVAASLALLHARRLVHRDVSASNVRGTASGRCKLLDFGTLAPFGYSGAVAGTPPFIAPEALRGGPIDHRADLFALGALAFFLLTGQHAFPAKRLEDLNPLWRIPPAPPSTLTAKVPKELDALVLSLLSLDPLARPTSAAEVIAMLEVIGGLPPEDAAEAERLAQSFLAIPRFVGRKNEMAELVARLDRTCDGEGAAVRVEAIAGMGRTRLVEELLLRAQIKGAVVLRIDGAAHRQPFGVARAMALRLFDSHPELSREIAEEHRGALVALGRDVQQRFGLEPADRPSLSRSPGRPTPDALPAWFEAMSRERPLVVAVDDVEFADETSFGLLTGLARAAGRSRILLVVTERTRTDEKPTVGLRALRAQCASMTLPALSAGETLELTRSVFGDAPNAPRFAEWMHERTAGSVLHFIEISRQLAAKGVASYVGGAWVLPAERPDSDPPAALEDALAVRLGGVSEAARALAECLALQRARRPTLELCRLLLDESRRPAVLSLLDELARHDVLHADADAYRFSSVALSDALLRGMSRERRAANHRRLGAALLALSHTDAATTVEAGFHLIQGGEELAGADRIAEVTADHAETLHLLAQLQHFGKLLEAALHVYERYSIPEHRRLPLLTGLAFAAYYEDRRWGDLYGDKALAALERACGLRLARSIGRFVGPALGLAIGVFVAFLRFHLARGRHPSATFSGGLTALLSTVTTLSGAAALALDFDRVHAVADVLSPLSFLSEKAPPVGVYRFCLALAELGREEPARATRTLRDLVERFERPDYYAALPAEARRLFIAGLYFAMGVFATFSDDAEAFARSADALDESGLELYAMIASQLRAFHHVNRGEFAAAAKHRALVELYAAHVGSAWQAELWEGGALFAAYANVCDVAGMMRIADQLPNLSATAPGAALYPRLARLALRVLRGDRSAADAMATDPDVMRAPRSFVGWSSCRGLLARAYNQAGDPAKAKAVCEQALAFVTPEDCEYPTLFVALHIERSHAEAALGDVDAALRRIDELVAFYACSDNPLLHGLLHEARALICWSAGRTDDYAEGVARVERSLRPTGTPALIAKSERLAAIGAEPTRTRLRHGEIANAADQVVTVAETSLPETA
ncbi:MAG TPA: protein kinase [Polyangiaceae bacterium]|nr:protein kinase [Polyangiaceae bacterium]